MKVEPFELIENYVRHPYAHVRRNVAVAISTLPIDESVAALLDLASSDPDSGVREEAERLLASIDPDRASLVRRELAARVRADDPSKRTAANALAGRLYLRGFDLRPPEQRLWHRLRRMRFAGRDVSALWQLAKDIAQRFQQAGVSRRFSLRTLWAGFLGSVAPIVLLSLYLAFTLQPRAKVYYTFIGFSAIAILILSLRVGRRDLPLILQWDEPAAIFRDMVETAIWTIALVTTIVTLRLIGFEELELNRSVGLGLLAGSVVTLALSAVHLGSAACAFQSKGGTAARLGRYFIALSSGLAFLTVALLIVRRIGLTDPQARLAEAVWLFGVPACGAVALILARLDTPSFGVSIANRPQRHKRHLVASALALPGVVVLSFWTWTALDAYLRRDRWDNDALKNAVDWKTLSGKTEDRLLPWRDPGTTYRFKLPFPQQVRLLGLSSAKPGEASKSFPLTFSLRAPRHNPNEGEPVQQGECSWNEQEMSPVRTNPWYPMLLAAGCYELRAARLTPTNLWDALTARTAKNQAAVPRAQELRIKLNAESAVWAQEGSAGPALDSSKPVGWIVGKAVAPLDIDVKSTVTAVVVFGRPVDGFTRAGDGFSRPGDRVSISIDAFGRTIDPFDRPGDGAEINLTGRGSSRFRNGDRLKPGRYSIALKPGPDSAVSAYLSFSAPSAPYPAGIQRSNLSTWTVTEAPSTFRFKLTESQWVIAELTGAGQLDMVLELVRLDEERLQSGDDPDAIFTTLAAGEYNLVVKTHERRAEPRGQRAVALPTPLQLVLDKVATSPRYPR